MLCRCGSLDIRGSVKRAQGTSTFVPALFTERVYTPKMAEENDKAVGAEVIKEAVCISADAKDHIKLAQHYIDMGFDHLIFHQARIKAGSWKRTATRCCPDCEMREGLNRTMLPL